MSRVGKHPVQIKDGVTVDFANGIIKVKGKLGELSYTPSDLVKVEIKDGEVIIMIDGNSLNTNIENLRKITRAELVRYNQDGLASDNVELNETALLIAKLKTAKGKKKDDISKT